MLRIHSSSSNLFKRLNLHRSFSNNPTFFQQNEAQINSQSIYTIPLQTAPLASVSGTNYSKIHSSSNELPVPHPNYHLQACDHPEFLINAQGDVRNQTLPLGPLDLYSSDPALKDSLNFYAKSLEKNDIKDNNLSIPYVKAYGKLLGHPLIFQSSLAAEQTPPTLVLYDSQGRRLDSVAYSPSYHKLMSFGQASGAVAYGFLPRSEKFVDEILNDILVEDRTKTFEHFYEKAAQNKELFPSLITPKTGGFATRSALMYMQNQAEQGHCCPLVMTSAALPILQKISKKEKPYIHKETSHDKTYFSQFSSPYEEYISSQSNEGYQTWLNKLFELASGAIYDPRDLPIEKKFEGYNGIQGAATLGMSMTEKQGGSDVRANTTFASPISKSKTGHGNAYLLNGHKWFTSAPMCDAFFTLAQTIDPNNPSKLSSAPSLFIIPRYIPGGARNKGLQFPRIKSKLGDRANCSGEVEYRNAWGLMIGEEGKGVKSIIEMVQGTRIDCSLGSSGTARRALQIAINHMQTRKAFGSILSEQPLAIAALAELAVESEAMTHFALNIANLNDALDTKNIKAAGSVISSLSGGEESANYLLRLGAAVSKYSITRRLPQFTFETMECMGGNGFVDGPMASLYRHAPVNSIWEGSGNVICLDVLRSFATSKDVATTSLSSFFREGQGLLDREDTKVYVKSLLSDLSKLGKDLNYDQMMARHLTDKLATIWQAIILAESADPMITEQFIRMNIAGNKRDSGSNYGGRSIHLSEVNLLKSIVDRNKPVFYNL